MQFSKRVTPLPLVSFDNVISTLFRRLQNVKRPVDYFQLAFRWKRPELKMFPKYRDLINFVRDKDAIENTRESPNFKTRFAIHLLTEQPPVFSVCFNTNAAW